MAKKQLLNRKARTRSDLQPAKLLPGLLKLIDEAPGGVMVEVGSYQGESARLFAKSGKFNAVFCVDAWTRYSGFEHFPFDLQYAEQEFDKVAAEFPTIIQKLKMLSKDAAKGFNANSLDFVYIDANHHYPHPLHDIELWWPRLREGGWLGIHDYCKDFPGVLRSIREFFGKNVEPDGVYIDTSCHFVKRTIQKGP